MKIDERREPAAAGQELPDIREQEPLPQLRRQLQRRRHVGKQAMQLGHQLRQLRRARTDACRKIAAGISREASSSTSMYGISAGVPSCS